MENPFPGNNPSSLTEELNRHAEDPEYALHGAGTYHHRHKSPSGWHEHSVSKRHLKRKKYRKIEAIMTSSILKTAGVILVILGIWFAIDPLALVRSLWNFILAEGPGSQQFLNLGQSWELPREILLKMALGFLITGMFLFLTVWRKSIELEIIALASWFIFGAWWIVSFYTTSSPVLYYGYILVSTLFFLLFFLLNIFSTSFVDRGVSPRIMEGILVLANGGFYYLTYYIYILPSRPEVILFTVALMIFLVLSFYLAEHRGKEYNRIPYFVFLGLVASAIFPLFTGGKDFVLFFSVLSMLMMLLLGTSRNNFYFFISTGALAVACLLMILNIVFRYIPYLLTYSGTPDIYMVFKGSMAFMFVLGAFIFNPIILKRNHLHISKIWYRKVEFLKVMKGGRLALLYVGGLWIYFYIMYLIFPEPVMKSLIWFSYHCLFFIIVIPKLVKDHSSFVPLAFFTGGVLTLLYPVILHPDNSYLQDSLLAYGTRWLPEFCFHYLNVLLLVILLSLLLRFSRQGMPLIKSSREIQWFFVLTMGLYIFFTELEHGIVLIAHNQGWIISETLAGFRKIPSSLVLAGLSLLILAIGFFRKEPFLRIFSLVLLGIAILKIVLSDILEAGSLTRTLIYISLGAVLIAISFYYPRLKKFYARKQREERRHNKNNH